VAITGLPLDSLEATAIEVRYELEARLYLRNPCVTLEYDRSHITVEMDEELGSGSKEDALLAINDDLSDVSCGLLPLEQDFDIGVVEARPATADGLNEPSMGSSLRRPSRIRP
jgi:hypothetical protein